MLEGMLHSLCVPNIVNLMLKRKIFDIFGGSFSGEENTIHYFKHTRTLKNTPVINQNRLFHYTSKT